MFYVTKTRLWDRDYGGAATVVATFVTTARSFTDGCAF